MTAEVTPDLVRREIERIGKRWSLEKGYPGLAPGATEGLDYEDVGALLEVAAAYLQVCEERDQLRERVERAGPSLRLSTTRAVLAELVDRDMLGPELGASLREALGGSDV